MLTKITFPDGESYSLTYSGILLTQVGAIDDTRTKINYDNTSQKRVTNINWGTSDSSLLESYSFSYKQNETKVTDIQSRSYTYQFNDFGQNTGIVSNTDGAAQYFEYNKSGTDKADSRANKLTSQSKVINTVTNYVINPSFTSGYSGYSTYAPDSTGSPSVTLDTTKGSITRNSLKVYKPSTNTNNVTAVQKHSNFEAGTYTLSGYIDTAGATLTGKGAFFGIEFWNSSGQQYVQRAEEIKKTNGWQRVSLTFTIPAGYELRIVLGFDSHGTNSYGTVWFDDLQLEKGTGMSSFTLVENSGFTYGNTYWYGGTLSSINDLPGFNKALFITGDTQQQGNGTHENIYPQNGKAGDVYSFGAWVKADSVPVNSPAKADDSCQPDFSFAMHFYDSNGTWLQTETAKANDDINTWQFISAKAVAKYDYAKVVVDLLYSYNANTSAIAGAFCFREEFGQTYTYDDNGNVISVVDLSNSESSFAFSGGQMAKMLNPSGSRFLYSYDEKQNLNYALSSDGQQYAFEYDDKGNVTNSEITTQKPVTTLEANKEYIIVNAYSGKALDSGSTGNISDDTFTSSYNPDSVYQHWKLVAVSGENNVYRIVPAGFPNKDLTLDICQAVTDDGGIVQIYTPNGNANQKFKITKDEENTFAIYTGITNYSKVIDAQYTSDEVEGKQYVKQNSVTNNKLKESMKWYFYPVEVTDGTSIFTSATYTDSKNFVASQTDQRGNTTTYNYDENKGTLTSVTDAKGQTTIYEYDANTNALGKVISGGMTNSYIYDDDRLTDINVNNGTRYKFVYDSFGRTTATKVGFGTNYRNLSTLEYNSAGLLSKQTYGNNDYISFTYDNLDRLTEKSYNNGNTDKVQYHYGTDGRLSQIIDFSTNSRMKYVYDLAGRVVSTREYDGANLTGINLKSYVNYTYADKTNYLTGVTHFSALGTQTIGYRYGDMSLGEMPDQIYGVTWNGDEKVSYTYDGLGRLTNKAINGVDTTYSYVDINGTKTTTLLKSLSIFGVAHNYEYDELGNITSIEFNNSLANSYEYDDLNQLVRENNHDQRKTFTYEYVNGNIKYKHEYDYTTGVLPTTPKKTIEYHYEDSTWSDVLTKITETTYINRNTSSSTYSLNGVNNNSSSSINTLAQSLLGDNYREVDLTANGILNTVGNDALVIPNMNTYSINSNTSTTTLYEFQSDEIGNITNVSGADLNWNGRRLESISAGGTDLISYEYNIDGQRISKTYDGVTTEYFYNGDILAGQKKGDDVIVFMYDNNGDIFGFEYNGTPYYYVKNAQNDVWLILDENGQAVVLYQYDAWGKVIGCLDGTEENIASINPITYRSYYMDLELGFFMYYLNSRYYMADWGRFVSADALLSTEQGMIGNNMFAYCGNNPVLRSDTSGNFWETVFDVVSLCVSIVEVASNPRSPGAWVGLVADAVDLIPFVTGVGEVVRGLNVTRKAVDTLNDARKASKTASNAYEVAKTGKKAAGAASDARKATQKVNIGCFVAGTQVLSAQGLVSIEDISTGDLVWAGNPETGEKELKRVVQTFVKEKYELVHIFVNGEEIVTTIEHPFYIPQKGWTCAIDLRAGDILVLQNGKYVVIEKVQHEILEIPVTVYNFEVEDFHTYYVGNSSVLVHNDCGPKLQVTYDTRKQAFNAAKREIGVPKSQQPIVRPNIGNRGELNPGRVYDFGNGNFIRDDVAGHVFSDGSSMGRHFNTSTGLHIFY